MSSYKAVEQARSISVPDDIAENPVIIGHEFCGEIIKVSAKWAGNSRNKNLRFSPRDYKDSFDAPGYSYRYIGGAATNIIIPNEVMEMGCLLPYSGEAFFTARLSP